jgi:EAL domain-containing protein (putative c-di-GMP-specific phosphodiesterase class I)
VCLSLSLACSAPYQGPQNLAPELLLTRVAKTVENLEEVMLLRTLQCR